MDTKLQTSQSSVRRHSPYNYAFDNPIYFIDYDGMKPNGCCGGNPLAGQGEGIARAFESKVNAIGKWFRYPIA